LQPVHYKRFLIVDRDSVFSPRFRSLAGQREGAINVNQRLVGLPEVLPSAGGGERGGPDRVVGHCGVVPAAKMLTQQRYSDSRLACILAVVSAWVLFAGCGDTIKPADPGPVEVPPTTLLSLGVPMEDSIPSMGASYYAARVTTGSEYFACIVALTDSAQFTIFEDSTFSDGGFCRAPFSNLPQSCHFIAYGDRVFIKVHSPGHSSPTIHYTLLVMASPQGPHESEQGTPVPVGPPVVGHVGTRSSSSYVATGLTIGREHIISLVGATGDVELCPGLLRERVGSVQECRKVALNDSLAFGVLCGPINREGAGYVLLVR